MGALVRVVVTAIAVVVAGYLLPGQVQISRVNLVTVLTAIVLMIVFTWFVTRTQTGVAMRATRAMPTTSVIRRPPRKVAMRKTRAISQPSQAVRTMLSANATNPSSAAGKRIHELATKTISNVGIIIAANGVGEFIVLKTRTRSGNGKPTEPMSAFRIQYESQGRRKKYW